MNYWNDLNTNLKGSIGEHKVALELVKHVGHDIFEPCFIGSKADLVFWLENRYYGVQVKNARLIKKLGHIYVTTCTYESGRNNTERLKYDKNMIDFISVYYFKLDKCYLIPIDEVGKSGKALRIEPPLVQHNRSTINWAQDYELDRVMTQLKDAHSN